MKALELKIPPLVLVGLTGLFMWRASVNWPRMAFTLPLHGVVAIVIALAGVLITVAGIIEFRRARTTVNPTRPQSSSALVNSGIYRHTRNPMYLGFLLILTSWAMWLANAAAFAFLPWFVLFLTRLQIMPEERALRSRFGETFDAYASQVRRWI